MVSVLHISRTVALGSQHKSMIASASHCESRSSSIFRLSIFLKGRMQALSAKAGVSYEDRVGRRKDS